MKKLTQSYFTNLPVEKFRFEGSIHSLWRFAHVMLFLLFVTSAGAQWVWNGSQNTVWGNGGNWNNGIPPAVGALVSIPNTSNDPVIDGISVNVGTLIIANSAKLTIESNVGLGKLTAVQIINEGTLDNKGEISIASAANPALIINSGTLSNTESGNLYGTTGVIELTPVGNLAIYNPGTFNNNHLLTIEGGGISAIIDESTGVFNNSGTTSIGTNSAILFDAVSVTGEMKNTGSFTIHSAGAIGMKIEEPGVVDNEGTMTIGTVSIGKEAVYINGDGAKFNNNGGTLDIDNTGSSGSAGNGIYLLTKAKFTNDGGTVNIDNTLNIGIAMVNQGKFENKGSGELNIGQNGGNIGNVGISGQTTLSDFTNNSSTVKIDNTVGAGINMSSVFKNSGSAKVWIGQGDGNVGSYGLRIGGFGQFTNEGSSELLIDNVGNAGIFFSTNQPKLTNKATATIKIGLIGNIGSNSQSAIETTSGHSASISNTDCAEMYLYDFIRLRSSASLTNNAFLFIDTNFGHTNDGSCTNNGVINYKQNSTIPNVTNNDIIVVPASTQGCKIDDVLQIGNSNDFTPLSTWYLDQALSNEAGTYSIATNDFTNTNLPEGTSTIYFTASDNNCTFDIAIDLTYDIPNQGYKTWTGINNRTWMAGCNWSPYGVPTSDDDVIIADVTNRPIIFNNQEGLAKSVKVETGAQLSIWAGGTLTIAGSTAHGFENDGTVNHSGTINLSDTQNNGVLNNAGGSFNCNGTMNISNVGQAGSGSLNGVENNGTFSINNVGQLTIYDIGGEGVLQTGGTFTNKGELSIGISGGNNNIIGNGISCQAPFSNDAGAELTIDNINKNGIHVISNGHFSNSGDITIGENTGNAPYGSIKNEGSGTFENLACGTLTMYNRLLNAATFNNAGNFYINTIEGHANSGTFTNDGVINYVKASFIPDALNNDLVIAPVSGACTISDILEIGSANNFTPAAEWFSDVALTNKAGDYEQANNVFMATNLTPNTAHTVYFTTTGNGCNFENSIEITLGDDIESPSIVCLNPTIELNQDGSYTLQDSDVIDFGNSSDNCGTILASTISPNTFDCMDLGVYVVDVTAIDLAGNEDNCIALVTIVFPSAIPAGTRTWTGAFSDDWAEPCNWNPIAVPTASDDVIIPDVAIPPIITSSLAVAVKSVNVETNGSLTINNGGSLTIDAGNSGNLTNSGTIENNGTIKIDNTSGAGINCGSTMQFTNSGIIEIGLTGGTKNISGAGIAAKGTFTNLAGAVIKIVETNGTGVNKTEGSFTNEGTINIGLSNANPNIGGSGMYLVGGFHNKASGIINIAKINGNGITNGPSSNQSTLTNEGIIRIGFHAGNINIGSDGIESSSVIDNLGGTIHIDRVSSFGILSDDSPGGANAKVTNSGTINIGLNGGNGNIGDDGFYNKFGDVTNSGTIRVSKTKNAGIDSRLGKFINSGTIEIGQSGNSTSITNEGLLNRSGTGGFTNESGGIIKIDNTGGIGLKNQSTKFKNYATIIIGQIGNIGGDGIENSGNFQNDACDALIHIVSNDIIDNQSTFNNNNGTIIEEASGNSNISSNNGIVLNLNGGTFNIITDNGLLTTTSGSYWTGCTDTDWNTASNWFNDAVPTAADDVVILATANAPVIDGSTMAVAQSVEVKSNTSLTINSGGSLTIDGSAGDGIALIGTLTNNGTLSIDNFSGDAIESQSGSSISNGGVINIGLNSGPGNVGGMGMRLNGPATNEISGIINVMNVVSNGIRVTDTSLDNFGEILLMTTNFSTGLYLSGNGATITNKSDASVIIDGFYVGYDGGNNTNFINEGVLTFNNQLGYSIDVLGNVTNTGTLKGNGKFIFNDDNTWDGTVSPGLSPGNIDLNDGDDVVLASTFTLEVEVNGTTPVSEHDRVRVTDGDIHLNGTLDVNINYTPSDGDRFVFLEADNVTGTFTTVTPSLPTYWSVDYSVPGEVALTYILTCGTTTWTGAAGTDWNDKGNWSLTIPKYCDDVIIPDVANDPIIDGSTAAEARSVTVQADALLTINTGGSLTLNVNLSDNLGIDNYGTIDNDGTITVDGSTGNAIYNEGTLDNAGTINIGHTQSPTQHGIQVVGTLTNTGTLDVKRGNNQGIQIDAGGELTNESTGNIFIGQNSGSFGVHGLLVLGTFTNDGGTANSDNATENGIRSIGGTINNLNGGTINIGTVDGNIGRVGLVMEDGASFTNDGSTLNINNTGSTFAGFGEGIACFDASLFENKNGSTINLGLIAGSIGHTGIYLFSNSIFTNDGADINIDNVGNDGILTSATFNNNNGGNVNIGWEDGNIGGDGIQVGFGGSYTNQVCSNTKVADNLNILNTFTNNGYLLLNTAESHTAGNFINNGIVEDVQGTFSGGTNNEIIIAPKVSECEIITDAFQIGATNDFNINGVFTDFNATISAGTYDVVSNVFTPTIADGNYTLYVEIEDLINNCIQVVTWMVTFGDATPPVFDVTDLPDLTDECSLTENEIPIPTATDFCEGSINGVPDISLNFTQQGTYTITWTYEDGNGNSTSQQQTVIIDDGTPPTPVCKTNTPVELDANGSYTIMENDVYGGGSDNCGTINFVSISLNTVDCNDAGSTVDITVTVNDGNGNENTCQASVDVQDNTKPTLSCPANIDIAMDAGQCGAVVSWNAPVAGDNCDGTFDAVQTMGDPSGSLFTEGTHTIEYTATDSEGNSEACTFSVTVQPDAEKPTLTCPANVDVPMDAGQCGAVITWNAPIADDNCDGTFNAVQTMGDPSGSLFSEGTYTIEYTATDSEGNSEACTFSVTVQPDAEKPTLTCPANIDVPMDAGQCGAVVNWNTPVAGDNCDGAFNAIQTIGDPSGSLFSEGNHTIEYTATDSENNSEACSFSITVQPDAEAPVPVCKSNTPVSLDANGNYSILEADVLNGGSDNCGTLNYLSAIPSTVNCSDAGNTVSILVTVFDANGNQATCPASVIVEDNESPQPTCLNPTVQLDANGTYTLSENEVFSGGSDNCGAVSFVSMTPATVSCTEVNSTVEVTVTAEDENGNQNTCTATVSILENVAPFANCKDLTVQLNANGEASIDASEVNNGSTDNCGIASTSLDVTDFDCTHVGANSVTLTVSDVNGNSATCNATVTVEDTVAPDAQCVSTTIQATLDSNGEFTIDPNDLDDGSSDACGIQGLSANPSLLDCSNEGQNAVTLSVTDVNGNTSTCVATIEVATFFSIDNIIENDESCAGAGDGSIVIEASTGGGQVGYSIDGGANFQFDKTFVSLTPGTYNIVVKLFGIPVACEKTATADVGAGAQAQTWYKDMDGDGFSDGSTVTACTQPAGYISAPLTGTDCDDDNDSVYPGSTEICDGLDNDCDGIVPADELDNDGDGYSSCGGDCDDTDASINPGATEICNGIDDDCDGEVDEGITGGETYTGNVTFISQADVDAWMACYSIIDGNLTITGVDITDLSNLLGIEEVTGTVSIYYNSNLTSLYGLDNLSTVGGGLTIFYNFLLSDCCAIHDLINGGVTGTISIFFNASGCNSVSDINSNCSTQPLAAGPDVDYETESEELNLEHERKEGNSVILYPNPATTDVTIQFGEEVTYATITVQDISGRIVLQKQIGGSVVDYSLDVDSWKAGTYIVMVQIEGRKAVAKRLVVIDNN